MIHKKKQTKKRLVLAAVMLAMFMAAVEATIVATAMPRIVADLGGFSHFSWVFSSYLLMQVIMIPIYGKLADIYGRKIIFSIGIAIFLIGSIFCGLSPSMELLIVSRFLQGVGAGAVQPIAMTIVGDIYTKEQRAKVQGYLSSIWGIAAIIGPLLGAFLVEHVHWAWVFWMNIPFGIIAVIMIHLFLHEEVNKKKEKIDYKGALLLLIAVSSLMLVLVQFDEASFLSRFQLLLLIVISIGSFIVFIINEGKVENPIITFSLWKRKEIRYANVASFTSGAMLLAVSSYLPTYVQGVLNKTPLIAGITLTAMSIGWPLSAVIAGRMMLQVGFRVTALVGGCCLVIGAMFYVTLPFIKNPLWAGSGSFILGAGLGFATTTFIVSIQSFVPWRLRGEATAMNLFMRLLGGAVGVSLLGGILNNRLRSYLLQEGDALGIGPNVDAVNVLLSAEQKATLTLQELDILQTGLAQGLFAVFVALFLLGVLSFIFIMLLPKDTKKVRPPEKVQ